MPASQNRPIRFSKNMFYFLPTTFRPLNNRETDYAIVLARVVGILR